MQELKLAKKALAAIAARLKSGKATLGQERRGLGLKSSGLLRQALV